MPSSARALCTAVLHAAAVLAVVSGASARAQARDPAWGDRVADSNAIIMDAEPTPAQRERIGGIVRREFEQDPATMALQLAQLRDGMTQLRALPVEARRLALAATRLDFLARAERDAGVGDALSKVILEIYRSAHPPIDPRAPIFSARVAAAQAGPAVLAPEHRAPA